MLIVDHGNGRHYGVSPVLLLMKFYLQCPKKKKKKKNCFLDYMYFILTWQNAINYFITKARTHLPSLHHHPIYILCIVWIIDFIYIYIYIYINLISKLTDTIDKRVRMLFTLILGGPQSDNNTRFCIFCIETKP